VSTLDAILRIKRNREEAMSKELQRVVIIREFAGLCRMGVCVVKDATDEEILSKCNSDNPSGTMNGWVKVIREKGTSQSPVACVYDPDRLHLLVAC